MHNELRKRGVKVIDYEWMMRIEIKEHLKWEIKDKEWSNEKIETKKIENES